jgi:hypothetical protein
VEGGLPISKRKRIYLKPGAPDLIRDLHEEAAPVVVDGTAISGHNRARLRLADLCLTVGVHSVAIGGVRYQLTLVDEFADGPAEGTLSFTFTTGHDYRGLAAMTATGAITSAGHHSSGDVTIKGAAITVSPSAREFPALPNSTICTAGQQFVLGRPGEGATLEMQPPKWLQELGLNPYPAGTAQ